MNGSLKKILLLVLAVSGLSLSAQASPMLDFLSLDDSQRTTITAIRAKNGNRVQHLKKKLAHARIDLEYGLKSDLADTELLVLYKELSQIKHRLEKLRFDNLLAIRKILKPSQRVLLSPHMIREKAKHVMFKKLIQH
jgi:Spy/CpxP family protein refolding chaperone